VECHGRVLYVKSRNARSHMWKVAMHAITSRINNRLPIRAACGSSSRQIDTWEHQFSNSKSASLASETTPPNLSLPCPDTGDFVVYV
jgi:hypothetical protein